MSRNYASPGFIKANIFWINYSSKSIGKMVVDRGRGDHLGGLVPSRKNRGAVFQSIGHNVVPLDRSIEVVDSVGEETKSHALHIYEKLYIKQVDNVQLKINIDSDSAGL